MLYRNYKKIKRYNNSNLGFDLLSEIKAKLENAFEQ